MKIKKINKEIFYVSVSLIGMLVIPFLTYVIHIALLYLVVKKGNEWFFKSLFYIFLLRFINPAFHTIDPNSSLLFVVIISIILIYKLLKAQKIKFYRLEKQLYLLIILFTITSILGSIYPSLSLFRLMIFSIVVFTAFQSIRYAEEYNFFSFITRVTILIIWFSVPFLFISAGYTSGYYMGITNYSQTFGTIVGPFLIIYILQYINRELPHTAFHLLTLLIGLYEMYMTSSRTALFSIAGALFLYYTYRIFNLKIRFSQKNIIFLMVFLFGSIVMYIQNSERINNKIREVIYKSHNVERRVDTMEQTLGERLMLIEAAKKNFLDNPWAGIGFGVQTFYPRLEQADPAKIKYIPGTTLIYSKPLEKGNVYFSILEEGGIFVSIYFFYIVLVLLLYFLRSKIAITWVTFLTILISFNGEAAFFAPAGIGNLQILLIAILYAHVHQKRIEEMKYSIQLTERYY